LCDQLGGIELGHDGLEDFVSDRGENTFIVIGTVGLDDSRLISCLWSMARTIMGNPPGRSEAASAPPGGAAHAASS
jgi:hypothetical protein